MINNIIAVFCAQKLRIDFGEGEEYNESIK